VLVEHGLHVFSEQLPRALVLGLDSSVRSHHEDPIRRRRNQVGRALLVRFGSGQDLAKRPQEDLQQHDRAECSDAHSDDVQTITRAETWSETEPGTSDDRQWNANGEEASDAVRLADADEETSHQHQYRYPWQGSAGHSRLGRSHEEVCGDCNEDHHDRQRGSTSPLDRQCRHADKQRV
jgi:hypothetical protein